MHASKNIAIEHKIFYRGFFKARHWLFQEIQGNFCLRTGIGIKFVICKYNNSKTFQKYQNLLSALIVLLENIP